MIKTKDKPPGYYIDAIQSLNMVYNPSKRTLYRHINST